MICTIAKRSAKRLKLLNSDLFTPRESAVSNFHTNLYGAIKRHNITAQSAPGFGHALSLFLGRRYQTKDLEFNAHVSKSAESAFRIEERNTDRNGTSTIAIQ